MRTFSFLDACAIVDNAGDFPKGLTKMLGMHDKFGNFRFLETDDYVAAEVFEKYPEESEKYADAVDEMGNSRFGGNAIAGIITAEMLNEPIKANPENINDFIYCRYVDNVNRIISAKNTGDIKPEDIDNILNLRRNDGSYVFNELPNCSTIKCYVKAPELFTKICNIRVPNSKRYVDPNYIDGLINRFISYPNETKQLLQMPGWNQYESRWSESDILEADKEFNVLKICANAPKAFMTLASLIDTSELQYIFRMKDICKIIIRVNYGKEILEFSKEDLQAIYELTQIRTKEKGSGNTDYLNADKICNLFNTYKQYPTETKEIIDNYFIEDEYGDIVSLIPSKADVELYINNRAEFEKQYPQEWG